MRIAVIGTGISGLAAAWLLNRKHEVHVFEANDYVGGHARTVVVRREEGDVALDTGFIVYTTTTYSNLVRLFDDLEYSGTVRQLFAQKRNLVRPSFVRMLHARKC